MSVKRLIARLALTVFVGCSPKKPAWVWYNDTCYNQWIQYRDGSFADSGPGTAAWAEPLMVPCTATYQLGQTGLTWYKVEYEKVAN